MGTWRNAMVALGLANEVDDEYYEDERLSHDEAAAPSRRTERGPEPAPEREAQVTPIRSTIRTWWPWPRQWRSRCTASPRYPSADRLQRCQGDRRVVP